MAAGNGAKNRYFQPCAGSHLASGQSTCRWRKRLMDKAPFVRGKNRVNVDTESQYARMKYKK